jgi:AcrR family transcriptional regulator
MTTTVQTGTAGRPRDPRIDRAVLLATEELVVEVGYADLTVGAIAERAGTTKAAIYRRWPGKAYLVHEAAFPDDAPGPVPGDGPLADDVRAMVASCRDVFSRPVARAALPGLLAEVVGDPVLNGAILARFRAGTWGDMHDRLLRAVASGEVRAGVDPDVLIETVGGATLLALLNRPDGVLDNAWVDQLSALLLSGLLPA